MNDEQDYICPNCNEEWIDEDHFLDDPTDRDASHVPLASAVACEECYRNEECPASCAAPHDPPRPDDDGTWQCPTDNVEFVATGDECDPTWNEVTRYMTESTLIHGEWYTDPWEHWSRCDVCEEWLDREGDNVIYTDDGTYCQDHGPRGAHATRPVVRCHSCNADLSYRGPVIFDTDTERVFCGTCAQTTCATVRELEPV